MGKGLLQIASDGLGYQPNSMANQYVDALQMRYITQNPRTSGPWLENLGASVGRIDQRLRREPLGVQRAIHNKIFADAFGGNDGKPPRLKISDSEMRKTLMGFYKTHNALADYYGIEHDMAAPPYDDTVEKPDTMAGGGGLRSIQDRMQQGSSPLPAPTSPPVQPPTLPQPDPATPPERPAGPMGAPPVGGPIAAQPQPAPMPVMPPPGMSAPPQPPPTPMSLAPGIQAAVPPMVASGPPAL